MLGFLKPPPHIERLPADQIDSVYKAFRWKIFAGIFFGYAGYYLLRKNFNLAMPYMIDELGYNKLQLGTALGAVSLAYGLSKFFMGNISDRSNARIFLPLGLLLSAAISFLFGLTHWVLSSLALIIILSFANGWVQGMGWPPCGRIMVHWWSHKERGSIVSIWNVAHNVGGGLIGPLFLLGLWLFADWHSVFYVPAVAAVLVALFSYAMTRDTPQSVGLPSIEEYKNDYPPDYNSKKDEQEFSAREIFFRYVFNNKLLWYIAIANVFVYLIRYGILDWSPVYLKEAKHFTVDKSSWAYFLYEWAGIPGTLLCGWASDKFFGGRRGLTGVVFMILTTFAVVVYWLNPAGYPVIDMAMLIAIGFLIYGPVMLIGLYALELVPKKAAGTAAGFTGMFGYIGGTAIASPIIGAIVDRFGWNGAFMFLTAGSVLAVLFFMLTLSHEKPREAASSARK